MSNFLARRGMYEYARESEALAGQGGLGASSWEVRKYKASHCVYSVLSTQCELEQQHRHAFMKHSCRPLTGSTSIETRTENTTRWCHIRVDVNS